MSQQVASLHAVISADTSGFEKGAAKVKTELGAIAPKIEAGRQKLTSFIGANAGLLSIAVPAVMAVGKAFQFAVTQAAEAQRVDAQLNAVLASTGGIAGMTAGELDSLATSLSRVSIYDDDVIKGSEALLLTFTKVGSDVFPQAQQAILDVSTAMGTDLQSATIQVGKALNDPILGLTSLSKAGIQFTAEQKKMIKAMVEMGDVTGAQGIILDELSTQFSGSALAAANTYEGQVAQLKNEWGNLAEAVGTNVVPALTTLMSSMKEGIIQITENAEANREFRDSLMAVNPELATQLKWTQTITPEMQRLVAEYQRSEEMGSFYASTVTGEIVPALEELAATTEEVSAANESMMGTIQSVNSETESYKQTQSGLREEMALLKEEYAAGSITQEEYGASVDIINGKVKANELAHIQAGKAIVFSMLQQKAAVDGLSDAEFTMLTEVGVGMGIFSQDAVDMAANYAIAAGNIEDRSGDIEKSLRPPISSITALNGKIEATAAKSGQMWDFYFNIHTTGKVPNLPGSGSGVTLQNGGANQLEERYASGGYGLSELGLGEMASVGEMGEEGIVRTATGLFVIPANKWRKMKGGRGWGGKEYGGGGSLSHGGPLTGEDLRNARIEQRNRRREEGGGGTTGGGGVVISPSTGSVVESEAAASPMVASMGLSGGPVGQSVAASAASQAVSSAQSARQLSQISAKLDSLIGKTAAAGDIASAISDNRSMYS